MVAQTETVTQSLLHLAKNYIFDVDSHLKHENRANKPITSLSEICVNQCEIGRDFHQSGLHGRFVYVCVCVQW